MPDDRERRPRGSARARILDATILVIAEDGIDAVTHRRVAEIAEVSPGSTTHHFASREDLIRAAFRRYLEHADRVVRSIDEEVRATTEDPVQRLRSFLAGILRREFTDEHLVRAEYEMMLFATSDEELAAHVRWWESGWITRIAENLEAAGAPRAIETARALVNLLRGYELERLLEPELGVDAFLSRLDTVLALTIPHPDGPRSQG